LLLLLWKAPGERKRKAGYVGNGGRQAASEGSTQTATGRRPADDGGKKTAPTACCRWKRAWQGDRKMGDKGEWRSFMRDFDPEERGKLKNGGVLNFF